MPDPAFDADQPSANNDRGSRWWPRGRKKSGGAGGSESTPAKKLRVEPLEPRILLSATWTDADGTDIGGATDGDDIFNGTAANELVDGLGGDDILSGGDGDDTFRFDGALDGDVKTVHGGADQDTINLDGYATSDLSFADGSITVDTGTGSFEIQHDGIETIVTADGTIDVIDSGFVDTGFSGTRTMLHGGDVFTLEVSGGGDIDYSFDATSGRVDFDDLGSLRGTSSLSLTSVAGDAPDVGGFTVKDNIDLLRIDGNIDGTLSTTVNLTGNVVIGGDVTAIEIDGNLASSSTSVTIGGDVGSFDVDGRVNGDITIGGDLDSLDVTDRVSGDVTISGDANTITIAGRLNGTIVVEQAVGAFQVNHQDGGDSDTYGSATQVTITRTDVTTAAAAGTNNAPVTANAIDAQATDEDAAFSFAIPNNTFSDADGDSLTLSATLADGSALPAWLSFDAGTGTFSGTPAQGDVGTVSVKVTAADPDGESTSSTFALEVENVNDGPVVDNAMANQSATEDIAFSYQIPADAFADEDGDTLTLSALRSDGSALPDWISFDAGTGTFSGTPSDGDEGVLSITVTAEDPSGASTSDVFSITIAGVEDTPTDIDLDADPLSREASDGDVVGTLTGTDGDVGETFTWSLAAPSPYFDIDGDELVVAAGADLSAPPDSVDVEIRVTDSTGRTYDETMTVTLFQPNRAPIVDGAIDDQGATEDVAFSFALPGGTFSDADADTLTLDATLASGDPLPAWLNFDAASGTFSGTPADADGGTISITVTATDPDGLSATDTFDLVVTNVNDAPVVAAPADSWSGAAGDPLAFTIPGGTFTDVDGDALTLSATLDDGAALPDWLSFDPATGAFTGSPDAGDAGLYVIDVTATDVHGETATDTIAVVVSNETVDATPIEVSADTTFDGFTGSKAFVSGDHAFTVTLTGSGSVDLQWDADRGELTITDTDGTDAASNIIIDDLGPTSISVDEIVLDAPVGQITISGSLDRLELQDGGSVGTIDVDGRVRAIDATGLTGGLTEDLRIRGSLGTFTGGDITSGTTLTVTGNASRVDIDGDVLGSVAVSGDLTRLDADTIAAGGSVAADDLGTATVTGAISGTIDVDAAGTLTFGSIASTGDVNVSNAITNLTVSGAVSGSVDADSATQITVDSVAATGDISVVNDVTTFSVTGAVDGDVTVGEGSGTITVDSIGASGEVIVGDDSGTMVVRGTVAGDLTMDDIDTLEVGSIADGGVVTVADDVNTELIVTGSVAGDLNVGDDVTSLELGPIPGTGSVTIGGSVADSIAVSGDVAGTLSFGGVIDVLSIDGNVSGDLSVGGDATTIKSSGTVTQPVTVGGDLERFEAASITTTITASEVVGGITFINGAEGQERSYEFTTEVVYDGLTNTITATITGGDANDVIVGTDDDEVIFGGAGNDSIQGSAGDDIIDGGDDSDTIAGGAGDDQIDGGEGWDKVTYEDASGSVNVDLDAGTATGADGNDTLANIELVVGSDFDDTITGSDDSEDLIGGDGDDVIRAGDGNDSLNGGAGDDILEGGAGTDDVTFDGIDGVMVDLAAGTATGQGNDTLSGIEQVKGSSADDTISGDAEDNIFRGDGGDDILEGRDGDDRLYGGSGNDILRGGDGVDTADFLDQTSNVTIDLAAGTANLGNGEVDTLEDIENLRGTKYADVISGDDGDNAIDGYIGDDIIHGGDGDDQIAGNVGDDTISGGLGDDALNGGTGVDEVTYADAGGAVNVDLEAGTATGADGNDTLSNFENVTGSDFNDTITGDEADNVLVGGAGDDVVDGGDGDDRIIGGAGDDTLNGGDGTDTLDYTGSSGSVNVDLAAGTASGADGNDTVDGFERVEGSAFDDVIRAGDADATLIGGAGNDQINGGIGNDTIEGGTGDDTINAGAGDDLISGGDGDDTIDAGGGNDTIYAGAGADAVDGGTGDDTLTYEDTGIAVDIDLTAGTVAEDGVGGGTIAGVENITGDGGNDTLRGDGEANTFDGGDGDDVFAGRGGDDTLIGGDGNDTAEYSGDWTEYRVTDNGDGTYTIADTVAGRDGTDIVSDIENFQFSDGTLTLDELQNAAPADLAIVGGTVDENAGEGTVVGSIDFSDENVLDEHRFELADDAGGRFEIDAETGIITVAGDADLNFESATYHDITVTVTDANGDDVSETFRIALDDVNEAPDPITIDSTEVGDTATAGTIVGSLTTTDPDAGDTLTVTMQANDWFELNGNDIVVKPGVDLRNSGGAVIVYVDSTDADGLSVQARFVIDVLDVNAAPIIDGGIGDQIATEDAGFTFQIPGDAFLDGDGDDLALTATASDGGPLPSWLSFDPATGTFSGTPENADVGSFGVQVTATDPFGESAATSFSVAVMNVNDAPIVAVAVDNVVATEDAPFRMDLAEATFLDVDAGDDLDFAVRVSGGGDLPEWLRFDSETGVFTGTPLNGDEGRLTLSVTATDVAGESVTESFTITVANTNDAPEVGRDIPTFETQGGAAFSFVFPRGAFVDIDAGDSLSLSVRGVNGADVPEWISFRDAGPGILTGVAPPFENGSFVLEIVATDESGESAVQTFRIDVDPAAVPDAGTGSGGDDGSVLRDLGDGDGGDGGVDGPAGGGNGSSGNAGGSGSGDGNGDGDGVQASVDGGSAADEFDDSDLLFLDPSAVGDGEEGLIALGTEDADLFRGDDPSIAVDSELTGVSDDPANDLGADFELGAEIDLSGPDVAARGIDVAAGEGFEDVFNQVDADVAEMQELVDGATDAAAAASAQAEDVAAEKAEGRGAVAALWSLVRGAVGVRPPGGDEAAGDTTRRR
ncbi:MAG: putative Ig domain-containing protein [Phycisphaerales bacterium]